MRTRYEKLRLPVSRLASAAAVFFLLLSTNRWEDGREAITTGLFTLGMFLVAIGSLGRMWCSLYIAGYKDQVLITQGPYSMTRNPLYFFSAFGALGVGFCTETFTFPVLLLTVMILYYPLVVRKEERRLRERFGREFDDYAHRVPVFFPDFSLFSEPDTCVVKPVVYRRHMFSALWFVWIVGLIEFAEGLKELGWMPSFWSFW
ncbi:MAG: isoprenylcysteine carboxylmethyltransferase family protein [Opitutae bacterium]|jgi:protein-S-isoprenylcysteine O-methyltransferase Ste14|nr:isoprenylcysteine carboxylmethyltransferase family protein [Opitutae bacterium]